MAVLLLYIYFYLLIVEPGHERELHTGHEDVGLEPPDVKLFARELGVLKISTVAVSTNHVGENEGVAYVRKQEQKKQINVGSTNGWYYYV